MIVTLNAQTGETGSREPSAEDLADLAASTLPAQTRAQWETAAIRRAAKALRPNREALDSLCNTRPAVDKPALVALIAEILRISALPAQAQGRTLVSLAASTNEATAYALLLAAYNAAIAAFYTSIALVDPSLDYRTEIKKQFDAVLDQIKNTL
jgi:hypothetical protein